MGINDRDYVRREGPSFLGSLAERGTICKWLIGINIFVFVLQLFTSDREGGWLTNALILNVDQVVFHGEIWRPLTSAFLHGGMFHIVGNMLSLVGLAFVLRRYAPRRRWLYIFLFTQYVGCIIAGYLNPGLMVGASVGIMGLLGSLFA